MVDVIQNRLTIYLTNYPGSRASLQPLVLRAVSSMPYGVDALSILDDLT